MSGDLDLRMVIQSIFKDKAQLDSVMNSIKGFQEGQITRNKTVIDQNAQAIQQMVRMGTITQEQLRGMNTALNQFKGSAGKTPFAGMAQDADNAGKSIARVGEQGKFTIRVLEAFVLYRGFVFLEQGAMNTTKALIDLNHQVSLILTQLPNFGQGERSFITRGIIEVATQTGQSFSDVARAEYQIVSASIPAAQSLQVLTLSAKAAAAGGTDVESAFNGALSQLDAFDIGVDQLSVVLDKQFNLVKRGIFTYTQFAKVSGITAEAFDQAGQSIDTANASLAAVSLVFTGPQLQRGATGLRNLVLAIADAPEKFSAIGVSTRDTAGNIRDLIPILDDLKAKMAGMPTGERATLISSILPDKREQAGLVALLQNMDALKRNYVEQRLAIGDLDGAYKTVQSDIQTQLGILKDSVESGFKPLANTVGIVVTGVNDFDHMLPGFTSGIIGMTAAIAALTLAMGYLNKQTAIQITEVNALGVAETRTEMVSRGRAFSMTARSPLGTGALSSRLTPLMLGAGVLAGSLGSAEGGAIGAGSNGFSAGGLLGSLFAGGATGAAGFALGPEVGIPSMIIGAVSSAFSYATTDFKDSMKDSGKSLAEVFGEELTRNHNVKDALQVSIGGRGSVTGDLDKFQSLRASISAGTGGLTSLKSLGIQSRTDTLGYLHYSLTGTDTKTIEDAFSHGRKVFLTLKNGTDLLMHDIDDVNRSVDRFAVTGVKFEAPAGDIILKAVQESAAAVAALRTPASLATIRAIAPTAGANGSAVTPDELQKALESQAIQRTIESNLNTLPEFQAAAKIIASQIADAVSSGKISSDQIPEALGKFTTGDLEGFFKFIDNVPMAAEVMESFAAAMKRAQDLLIGNFDQAANVFEQLGDQGKALSGVFRDIARVQQGLTLLQNLHDLSVNGKNPLEGIIDFSGLTQRLSDFALNSAQKAGGKGDLTEALFQSIVAPPQAQVATALPSMSGLDDSIRYAAEHLDSLSDTFGYTKDNLTLLADNIENYNKTVFKIGIIQEFQKLGEMVGLDARSLDPAIKNLVNGIVLGGTNFADFFKDPSKLADLLAEIKFGDINVDQSMHQDIVVRIDGGGDLNTVKAAQVADDIIMEMNRRTNRRVAA